jgi:CubicO group peptidase (beta-lactamase class C family)
MRPDTIFQIRSMTKPVTAAAIMILLEEGRLHLMEPVEKHLPEFRGISVSESREGETEPLLRPPSRAFNIYDLLTHTSGLREHEPGRRPLGIDTIAVDTIVRFTMAEYVANMAELPLEFEPGAKFQYSDVGFNALGRIIEVVSGQPYEEFIEETILKPLGMKDSFFFVPPDKRDRIPTCYSLEEGKLKVDERKMLLLRPERKNPGPSWGMFATASDTFAFHQMMLNGGAYNGRRILSRASVAEMTRVHATGVGADGLPNSYGLGWFVRGERGVRAPLASIGAYGHPGVSGTMGRVDPKKGLVAVFLVQRTCDERIVFQSMAAAAVAD